MKITFKDMDHVNSWVLNSQAPWIPSYEWPKGRSISQSELNSSIAFNKLKKTKIVIQSEAKNFMSTFDFFNKKMEIDFYQNFSLTSLSGVKNKFYGLEGTIDSFVISLDSHVERITCLGEFLKFFIIQSKDKSSLSHSTYLLIVEIRITNLDEDPSFDIYLHQLRTSSLLGYINYASLALIISTFFWIEQFNASFLMSVFSVPLASIMGTLIYDLIKNKNTFINKFIILLNCKNKHNNRCHLYFLNAFIKRYKNDYLNRY